MPCTTSGLVVDRDHAEARRRSDLDLGYVSHAHRRALDRDDDDVLDVVHVVQQADAADVVRLLADLEALAAGVDVRVLHCRDQLLHRDAVALESVRIDADVKLLGLATEAGHVDDARNLSPLALEDPVLGRLELHERVALAFERVAEHLADRVPR